MSRKKYLVTGATGFLGHHLVPLLLADPQVHVVALVRRVSPELRTKWNGSRVTLVEGDLLDWPVLAEAARGCQGIFHLAGLVVHSRRDAAPVYRVNLEGTLLVMRAAREAGRIKVVYASSSGVQGCFPGDKKNQVATERSPYCWSVASTWPYYHSKILAEVQALQYAKEHAVPLVMMRPSMMLGPGDERFRSTHTVVSFLQRKMPLIPSGGASFVDIRDVAAAFVAAMQLEEASNAYLLGACNCSLMEFFTKLEKVSGVRKPLLRYIPAQGVVWVAIALDWFNRNVRGKWEPSVDPVRAEMGGHYWNIDSSLARKELGFEPRDPDETLRDTVEYIRAHHKPPLAKL